MVDYDKLEERMSTLLGLERRPIAIAYRDSAPANVRRFTGAQPSGCSFWRLAAEGETFYTTPADHYNCPIGSYTHNIDLPKERGQELNQTLSLMMGIGYIKAEDLPQINRLPHAPAVVVYSPLGESPLDPDVVLFVGKPGRLMLLAEAALRMGLTSQIPFLARPTCMALPAAMTKGVVVSAACVGNRTYTDIGEDELYFAVSGKQMAALAQEMETIMDANNKLREYHMDRRREIATN